MMTKRLGLIEVESLIIENWLYRDMGILFAKKGNYISRICNYTPPLLMCDSLFCSTTC